RAGGGRKPRRRELRKRPSRISALYAAAGFRRAGHPADSDLGRSRPHRDMAARAVRGPDPGPAARSLGAGKAKALDSRGPGVYMAARPVGKFPGRPNKTGLFKSSSEKI